MIQLFGLDAMFYVGLGELLLDQGYTLLYAVEAFLHRQLKVEDGIAALFFAEPAGDQSADMQWPFCHVTD